VIGRVARRILLKSDGSRGICLRVTINEEGGLVGTGEACRQVHSCSRFSNPTFLVGNRDDPGQSAPPNQGKIAELAQGSKMFHVERWKSVEGLRLPESCFVRHGLNRSILETCPCLRIPFRWYRRSVPHGTIIEIDSEV